VSGTQRSVVSPLFFRILIAEHLISEAYINPFISLDYLCTRQSIGSESFAFIPISNFGLFFSLMFLWKD
jgi:hypothetical protein